MKKSKLLYNQFKKFGNNFSGEFHQSEKVKIYKALEISETEKGESLPYQLNKKWYDKWAEPPVYIPDTLEIPDTKLFIGFDSENYTTANAVTPDINIIADEGDRIVPKSRCFTILGEKGSGKSILSSIIVFDNIIRKFHIPTLIIDPAGEYYMHKYSLRHRYPSGRMEELLDDYETHFQVKFQGYKLKVARVGFDTEFAEEGIDADLILTLNDFRELYSFSKVDGIQSLLTMLNLQDSKPSEYLAAQVLANPNFHNFGEVLDSLKGSLSKHKKKHKGEDEDDQFNEDSNDVELVQNSRAFRNYLEEALLLGSLSKETDSSFNLLSELMKNDSVIIKGKQKLGEDSKIYDKYLTYLKIYLVKILMALTRYYAGTKEEKAKAILNNPLGIAIIIDEADTIVQESGGGFLSQLIVSLATKYRKWGVNVITISQNASLLNHVLLQQSDAIFVSRLKSKDNLHAVLERGISKEAAEILRHLESERKNSMEMLVSEWAYISMQNDIVTFFPAVPLSDFKSQ